MGSRLTRGALATWLGSRIAVVLVALVALHTTQGGNLNQLPSFTRAWDRWDVGLFIKLAKWGYFDNGRHYPDCCTIGFFPGEPLTLRLVHLVVPSWVWSGLAISFVSGAIACVALARLAVLETRDTEAGRSAVLFLVLSPYAVFLFAGYSESLFLAFAVSGWLAARQRRWELAGLLIGAACVIRITGLFLGVALVLEFLLSRRRSGDRIFSLELGWVLVPMFAIGSYAAYLHHRTGDWLAWPHAQAQGWHRTIGSPLRALQVSAASAVDPHQHADFSFAFGADTATVCLGVLAVIVFAYLRQWPAAVFIALNVISLSTSEYFLSVSRSALLWFPMWVLLAQWSIRRRWLVQAYAWVSAPIMAGLVAAFVAGHWVD